jgi:hypothetical protein
MEADQQGSGKKKGEGKVASFVHHYLHPSRPKCEPSNRENSWKEKKKIRTLHYKLQMFNLTGKSLSEALIFASNYPQYDNRLFIELPVHYMKIASSERSQNMLCKYIKFFFDILNNLCTQHVLRAFWVCNFHVLNL